MKFGSRTEFEGERFGLIVHRCLTIPTSDLENGVCKGR